MYACRRSYHTLRAVPRVLGYSVRGLHSDDLFLGEKHPAKHPDDEHADRIRNMDKNPGRHLPVPVRDLASQLTRRSFIEFFLREVMSAVVDSPYSCVQMIQRIAFCLATLISCPQKLIVRM